MAQNVINIGTIPNDGTGDPLRVAFNDTNLNFDQIFATGIVNSNIQVANTTILTINNNGNLVFAPNGVGRVVANADIVPNSANIRNLGALTNRWNTVYSQYVNATNLNIGGNATITGNLTVMGNTVTANTSTLDVANAQITLGVGATNPFVVDGGGIYLEGANASMSYSSADNSWNFNIPVSVNGTITAEAFSGDGGLLTNVQAESDAALLTGNTLASGVINSSLTSVGPLVGLVVDGNLAVAGTTSSGYFVGNGGGLSNIQGANVVGFVANATFATTANSAIVASQAATAVTANTAITALTALRANTANVATTATFANIANVANFATTANAANTAIISAYSNGAGFANTANTAITVTGNAQPNITSTGTLVNLTVAGNIITGAILTDGYFYANGAPFAGGGGGGNTGVVLGDQQIIADGTAAYTLTQASTSNTALISINGVSQAPTTAYTIAGTVLTFAGAVANGSLIDVRFLGESGAYPGTYGNANVGAYLPTYPGSLNPSSISTDVYTYANGTPINFGGGNYGNSNVAAYLPTYSGDLNPSQINTNDYNYANGAPIPLYSNAAVSNFLPIYVGNIGATITDASQPYITSLGTLTSLAVTGGVTAATLGGSLTTAAQPNVTSVGTLNNLNVTANTRTANIFASGYFYSNGVPFTASNYGNTNVAAYLPFYNGALNPSTVSASGLISAPAATFTGNVQAANFLGLGIVEALGTVQGGNVVAIGNVTAGANVNATVLKSITANITGNAAIGGILSNNYYWANGVPISFSSYTDADVAAFLPTYTGNLAGAFLNLDYTANVGNLVSRGAISGNTLSANLVTIANTLTAKDIVTTGNVTIGQNLVVNGNTFQVDVSALNVSSPIIGIGRGANNQPLIINDGKDRGEQLWYYSGNEKSSFIGYQNSTGNILAATEVSILNDIVTVTDYGNLQVGNIVGFGYLTATGDITGNSMTANANITATGNVQGGNLKTAGSITATGNITGNNITTLGTFTANNITVPGTATISTLRVVSDNVQVGNQSGITNQASYAIAIGSRAGQVNQGNNAIAIGSFAGNATQPANSIILNASGSAVNANTSGFFVSPIRASNIAANVVWFNSNTNELTYQPYIIWVNGGDMGLVTQPVTFSQDLGLVTDSITTAYDLGIVTVEIITGNNIVDGSITGNKLSPSTSIITTGNVVTRFCRTSVGGFFPSIEANTIQTTRIQATTVTALGVNILANYPVAGLPPPAYDLIGAFVFVTNAPGGSVPAFCDGANWRSVVDRSIIA
jgi:hypothetical protein